MRTYLASALVFAACTQAKTPVDDDFSALSGQDDKSDVFSHRMKVVGSLSYGTASPWTRYTRTPRYRAVTFTGTGEDRVDAWVRSSDGGDAVAWLLDKNFRVLAANDDADETTYDAHLSLTLPPGPSAKHYIVWRDYDLRPADFIVQLEGAGAGPSCTLDSQCVGIAIADGKVPLCNNETHVCERVAIEDIVCGGFLPPNPHQCPAGYTCVTPPLTLDAPGHCEPE